MERMEDILTSNVFSFFKYSTREIFLKGYLNKLGFDISGQEANAAELIFWPRFEENTEPDLVIITGDYSSRDGFSLLIIPSALVYCIRLAFSVCIQMYCNAEELSALKHLIPSGSIRITSPSVTGNSSPSI